MRAAELARVALACRNAQKEYFYSRSHSALQEAKRLEKKLDRCVAIVLDDQQDLFPKDPPSEEDE